MCSPNTSLLVAVFLLPSWREGWSRLSNLWGPEQNEKRGVLLGWKSQSLFLMDCHAKLLRVGKRMLWVIPNRLWCYQLGCGWPMFLLPCLPAVQLLALVRRYWEVGFFMNQGNQAKPYHPIGLHVPNTDSRYVIKNFKTVTAEQDPGPLCEILCTRSGCLTMKPALVKKNFFRYSFLVGSSKWAIHFLGYGMRTS